MIDLENLKATEVTYEEDNEYERERSELQDWALVNVIDMPDYGDIMSVTDWKDSVACGAFIDYDGFGEQVILLKDGRYVISSQITPSRSFAIDDRCTHIIWYNR
jgi:hypothetical protein